MRKNPNRKSYDEPKEGFCRKTFYVHVEQFAALKKILKTKRQSQTKWINNEIANFLKSNK